MLDLADKAARDRLWKAVKSSREAMFGFRQNRRNLLRDYVGSWYQKEGGARFKTLVNLIQQTAKIYTVALAANNPRVMISSQVPEYESFAKRFQINLNRLVDRIELDVTMRAIVLDAFFCIGCACVMMRDTDTRFHGLLDSE